MSGDSLTIRNLEYLLSLNKERHFAPFVACSFSQPTSSAGIKQLEEDMDVLIVKQPIRIICLSRCLLGAVL
jgi:hypothetical protein